MQASKQVWCAKCVCVCLAASSLAGRLGLAYRDRCWIDAWCVRHGLHSVLNLGCHRHERLLYICCILGARLQERNSQMISEFLSFTTSQHVLLLHFCYFVCSLVVRAFVFILLLLLLLNAQWNECCAAYFGGCVVDDLFGRKIAFVSNEQLVDILIGVAFDFLKPVAHVLERLLVGHVVDDNDAVCATVVARSNSTESFLTSRVPL